jgi:hypothetical protein
MGTSALDQLLLEAVRSRDQLDEFGIGLCRTPVPDRPVDGARFAVAQDA